MDDEKAVFRETFVESATLDDWVAEHIHHYSVLTLEEIGEREDMDGGDLQADGLVLPYHWQRFELYMAYKEDMWDVLLSLAEDSGYASVLDALVGFGDGFYIDSHEAFIDVVVTRVVAVVANDLVSEDGDVDGNDA